MSIDLRYDQEKKILYATIREQIRRDELANALEAMTNSTEYPPTVSVLWDARTANMPTANMQFEMQLLDIRKRYPAREKSKIAVIVSNDLAFGMSRMFEMLSDTLPQNMMVFKDYGEGEEWLLGR